ncbi:unnamed protein product [Rhizophagus irregularis]|uniref:Uncharacterized protein n=1 Tax=Rhizophagus irregularis TaxID=588596 RepID=A0A2I1HTW3_9GLOM|nr:hypothetical protein RhiirA4_488600 [Rhizophagus irregularis]CAB4438795.1 unnamed protein product [Rhizophagus irregularis]
MAANLTQRHREELAESKIRKNEMLIHLFIKVSFLPNIDCANVNTSNPLLNNQFVIIIFGSTLCIARIVAMYYNTYNYHSYYAGEVTDLDNLSYIMLHVFLPLHLNIFSGITSEKSKIFTHQQLSNIIYHLANTDVIVAENSLNLRGFGKDIYNYFNCEDIKKAIITN